MSNGDDILDSWEEIDEAGLTSKLHKIREERKSLGQREQQEQLTQHIKLPSPSNSITPPAPSTNSKPMKLMQRTSQDGTAMVKTRDSSSSSALKSPLDSMPASFQPVMMVLHQPADEYQSANYTPALNNQTVKILRRPTQSSEQRNNGMQKRQPIKTLQQREQEYAEARLRILGSAKNPEDEIEAAAKTESVASTTTSSVSSGHNNLAIFNTSHQPGIGGNNDGYNYFSSGKTAANAVQSTWSPVVGGSVSTNFDTSTRVATLRQQQGESILRMPQGPDGSAGFQMRR